MFLKKKKVVQDSFSETPGQLFKRWIALSMHRGQITLLLLITNIDSINLEPITWASNFYVVVSRCFQGKVNF